MTCVKSGRIFNIDENREVFDNNIFILRMTSKSLDLSYEEYIKNGKSIADSYIAEYIIYEKLDSGAFGSVYRGMHR